MSIQQSLLWSLCLSLCASRATVLAQTTLSHPPSSTKGLAPHKNPGPATVVPPGAIYFVIGSDNCSTPAPIAGNGVFPFDTIGATTGTQGQSNAACNLGGQIGIDKDVWFAWTAPVTGVATISLCTQTSMDSKLAVYAGSGCPSQAPLGCDDDTCSVQSRVTFACTNANVYTIQLGSFPGSAGGTGTMTISTLQPPANDQCASPATLVGAGPFAFNNTQATTGTQGQSNAACNFANGPGIQNDIWFTWTAPSTGAATLSFCSGSTMDSKVAVYAGAGCPAATAIACNDDACGVPATVCFNVAASSVYTIQVGNFPSASGGSGTFSLSVAPIVPTCQYDAGSSDNSLGLNNGGALCWMHRFGAGGSDTVVSSIATTWGSPTHPNGSPPNGTAATLAIWDDPNDDGNPSDCVLVRQIATTVANANTNTFNTVQLVPPVNVKGVYFVGASVVHAAGKFPAPLDQTACGSMGRAWQAGATNGVFNFQNLAANDVPPAELDSIGIPGVWLLRAGCQASPGFAFCFGDDIDPLVTTDCPCLNFGAPGRGCGNSVNASGAVMTAVGATAGDTVQLTLYDIPPTAGSIYLQGDVIVNSGLVFGDGLRCAGGFLTRMGLKIDSDGDGSTTFGPASGDPQVSVAGNASAGNTYAYQAYYRNPNPTWCPPATFNVSQAIKITW